MGKHTAPRMGTELAAPPGSTAARSTPYRDRAEAAGIDVDRVEHVSSTSEISLQPHTVYAVSGRLERDGDITGHVDNVAIVGLGGVLPIPKGDRGYDVNVRGGPFLFSGIDLAQHPSAAWGRIRAVGDRMTVANVETLGRGHDPQLGPNDSGSGKAGPTWDLTATSPGATNTLQNITDVHGGVFPRKHFGNRPIGVFLSGAHEGTLRVLDSHIESYSNNALYCTAAPGDVEIERCTFKDNGVTAGGRIAHGYWKDCHVEFDAHGSTLRNANAGSHGVAGIAAEQKKAGANGKPGPDVINTTVKLTNVAKAGSAVRSYDIHRPADWGRIVDCDIHVEQGAGRYTSDLSIHGDVAAIKNCEFSGSNQHFVSILNRSGERIVIDGYERDYPRSRGRDKGAPVDWR